MPIPPIASTPTPSPTPTPTPTPVPLIQPPADLRPDIPAGFTRFEVGGQPEVAQRLGRFLWYHLASRLGEGRTLFNQEYLATSDLWVNDAGLPKFGNRPIQEVHRNNLLTIDIDPEGYVRTHQHISVAYDHGWPFPFYGQGGAGLTFGFIFKDHKEPHMWLFGEDMKPTLEASQAAVQVQDLESSGIVDNCWKLKSNGPQPRIETRPGFVIDAFNAPYIQIRWLRSGTAPRHQEPYLEWKREGDTDYSPARRASIPLRNGDASFMDVTKFGHSLIELYNHPLWKGKITALRFNLAPGEPGVEFSIDSIFSCYDTRHTVNNPILILASWDYFRWTGDLDFLRQQINRLRTALRYQQVAMHGLELNHLRVNFPGHDGRPGWVRGADGKIAEWHQGHGIGNNYWDLMPFGYDDFYATYQYYAATLAMARLEELIRANPGWQVATGAQAMDPTFLREHAAKVRSKANELFWNSDKGRFIASIDADGKRHDYGYTFVNLDAIWYGVPTPAHARSILDWIDGRRVLEGETSTGKDIYHWEFGPRASTIRNLDWYGQGWQGPEAIPWGGQVQDGGAVLGFSFYDLWARLKIYDAANAWQRLTEIMDWDERVQAAGGYREYYKDGKRGTSLQGGGTAGGLGIDCEFFESSMIPAIVPLGFLGLDPQGDRLRVEPNLPAGVPSLGMADLKYHGLRMDLQATTASLMVQVKDAPGEALAVELPKEYAPAAVDTKDVPPAMASAAPADYPATGVKGQLWLLEQVGRYRFVKR